MEENNPDVFQRTLSILYRCRAAELGFPGAEFSFPKISDDGAEVGVAFHDPGPAFHRVPDSGRGW